MTSVRLKPATEAQLKRVASIQGKTVSRVVQEAVEGHCDQVLNGEQTLDKAWADYIGALDSGGKSDSSKVSEVFGQILEEKKRNGRL